MALVPARKAGSVGMELPRMALGSWHTWNRARFADVVSIVKRAVDTGAALFDAAVYRPENEFDGQESPTDILLGRALQVAGVRREDYLLSIKGWLTEPSGGTLVEQADELLVRHGADFADLMVLGGIADESRLETDLLAERLGALLASGKVRHYGVNNWSAAQIERLGEAADRRGVEGPQLAQQVYSITHRTVCEGAPFRRARERTGIALQASDIFDGGRLLGKSARHTGYDVGGLRERENAVRADMTAAAGSLGLSLAQFCFAYPLTNPDTDNVLVGVSRPEQFEELAGVFDHLEREGVDGVREAASAFWLDREAMDPAGEAA